MKIYIVTDMEGVSGLCKMEEVQRERPEYQPARHLLCGDVNAAIAGAFDGGATEVIVNDGHGGGFNLILEEMDTRAVYERPNGGLDMLPALDDSFAAVFCVGYHAMAGTLNGFLDHPQSSASWFEFSVNGRPTGELGQIGLLAGHYGLPVTLVAGDQAACDEGREFFGEIETAAVKQGIGRQHARCLHPEKGRALIRAAATRAVALTDKIPPYSTELPATVRLTYYRSDMADGPAQRPGTRRINARTLERTVEDLRCLLGF